MRRVSIITSDRSVSLQRVANDIASVFRESGARSVRVVLSARADPRLYNETDVAIVVMTFDPAWIVPYAYVARALKVRGKRVFFYTTVEGRIRRVHGDEWIYRDLSFVANSNYTKEKLVEAGARVDRVVYHGVRVDAVRAYRWKARALRQQLGLSEDDFVVGYVAGGYMRKGHDVFAEVCRIVQQRDPSIKIVVLTDKRGADHYGNTENVILVPEFGKLSNDMVYGLYHVFDLYAQASLSEGFGMPILESLAAGKPVVHADYAPLSEITTPRTSFRVRVVDVVYRREMGAIEYELHQYDPKEFAEAILYAKDEVLRNRDEYEARCLERAMEFDARKVYSEFKTMSLYGGTEHGEQVEEGLLGSGSKR
ncbi:MAG: glycosyltransferase [Methanotrichaceae archaeon]